MFSIGNTPPSPKSITFASAGTNCVDVTRTLTQFSRCAIILRHVVTSVAQLSVRISISFFTWIQWSSFGPNKPPTLNCKEKNEKKNIKKLSFLFSINSHRSLVSIVIVDLLNFTITKCEFFHPIHATTNSIWQTNILRCSWKMEKYFPRKKREEKSSLLF